MASNTVSTQQLISAVAEKFTDKLPKKMTKTLLTEFLSTIETEIAAGNKARIDKIGVLYSKERAARTGRNPQTGEAISIPASKKVSFRAAKSLKEAVGATRKSGKSKR